MVAGYVSKDSWSRCETPSMLYDTVKNPLAAYCAPKPVAAVSGKDTIETTEQRLKREIVDRFHAKGLELSHETYVAVVQVGKYVFLAVMLPVYLGLYGIPHWFLVTALPQLFGIVGKCSMYCGRFALTMAKRVKDLMKGMLEQLIGDALRLSRDRARNFWKRLTAPWTFSAKVAVRVADAIRTAIHKGKEAIAQVISQFHSRVDHNVHATNRWIIDNAMKAWMACMGYAKSAFHFMDQRVLTPFILFCLPPFRLAAKAGRFVGRQGRNAMRALSRWRKKVTDPAIEHLQKRVAAGKKILKGAIGPVANWLGEKKDKMSALLAKAKKAVVDPVVEAMVMVKNKIPELIKAGWHVLKPALWGSLWVSGRVARFAWKMTPQKFKDNMDRKRQGLFTVGRVLRNMGRGTVSGIVWMLRGSRFILWFIAEWAVFIARVMWRYGKKMVAWLAVLPRKMKQASIVILNVIIFIFSRMAFAVHVVVLLIWLASINGFYLMRHMLRQ